MLHNKRLYGELFGIIKPKWNINPYNKNNYINENKYNQIQFNPHTFKLSFKSYQTEQCENGCYLFITFYHFSDGNTPTVGFEYTLLARIWDEEEISPQIINIPFNEYIFGYFEKDSINHHYYCFYIPNDTDSIIIQYEGKSIEGFIGYGKRKLNTLRKLNNTHNLNLTENKMIRQYSKNELNELKIYNYISFTFRIKYYFTNQFSIYYFRILLLKKGENNIIYPLDSNIGNFCSPKREKDQYYCYFLLKNYYNDFSLNYYISTSNNDKLTYNYFKVINGEIIGKNVEKYVSQKKYDNDNASLFKFIFENEKIVNILSTLFIKKQIIYPQIYSLQMFHLRDNKILSFNMNQNLLLILNYISGKGIISFSDLLFYQNVNFKGKPIFFFMNETSQNLSFSGDELNIFSKFEEINKIRKITQGETLKEFVRAIKLPIYYYIKNEEEEINNLKIYFKIKLPIYQNKIAFFDISGYIMNESDFNSKKNINDEFIGLKDPIKGSYDIGFKIGILNINKTIKKGDYILIKIDSNSPLIFDRIIIDIITMLKKDGNYLLPINSYINDIYDSSENKRYKIIVDKDNLENQDIFVEFIPDNNKIKISKYLENEENKIKIENITDNNGTVQKFRISDFNDDFFLKVDAPQNINYANYIIRYYFTKKEREEYYILNKEINKIKENNDDITFEFNLIKIPNIINKKIYFKIYGILYENENDIKNEFLNSSETIKNNIIKNQTYTVNNLSFKIYFSNIRSIIKKNYDFNLQLKIVIENDLLNEDLYMYKLPINLENEFGPKKKFLIWIIIIASSILIIVIIIVLVVGIFKLKKKNNNLQERISKTSFTNYDGDFEQTHINNDSKMYEDKDDIFI